MLLQYYSKKTAVSFPNFVGSLSSSYSIFLDLVFWSSSFAETDIT